MDQAVQGRHARTGEAPQDREVEKVAMKMKDVKAVALPEHELHKPNVVGECLANLFVTPECFRATRHESSRGLRVAAGEERDLVTLADHLFSQVRNHPLRAAVKFRRNAFIERGNLGDPHEKTRVPAIGRHKHGVHDSSRFGARSLFAFPVHSSTGYPEIEPVGRENRGRRRSRSSPPWIAAARLTLAFTWNPKQPPMPDVEPIFVIPTTACVTWVRPSKSTTSTSAAMAMPSP